MSKEKTPTENGKHPLLQKPRRYQRPRRRDRSYYDLDTAMEEIALAETLLDLRGAPKGLTLWGRITGLLDKVTTK